VFEGGGWQCRCVVREGAEGALGLGGLAAGLSRRVHAGELSEWYGEGEGPR